MTKKEETVFKKRNPFIQLILLILTFGFYVVIWYFETNRELENVDSEAPNPSASGYLFLFTCLMLLLSIILNLVHPYLTYLPFIIFPFLIIITVMYVQRYANSAEIVTNNSVSSKIGFFLLLFVFPIGMIYFQLKYNKMSNKELSELKQIVSDEDFNINKNKINIEEENCKCYIQKFNSVYTNSQIRKTLQMSGITEEKIEEYLEKYLNKN